jgi:hypothetical protein
VVASRFHEFEFAALGATPNDLMAIGLAQGSVRR